MILKQLKYLRLLILLAFALKIPSSFAFTIEEKLEYVVNTLAERSITQDLSYSTQSRLEVLLDAQKTGKISEQAIRTFATQEVISFNINLRIQLQNDRAHNAKIGKMMAYAEQSFDNEAKQQLDNPSYGMLSVVKDGKTIISQGIGHERDRKGNIAKKIDKNTVTPLGCFSKPLFVQFVLGDLVEKGKLSWKTTMGEIFPEQKKHKYVSSLTVEEIVRQVTGFRGWRDEDTRIREKNIPVSHIFKTYEGSVKDKKRGVGYSYQNTLWCLLTEAVKRKSESVENLYQKNMLDRFKMTQSSTGAKTFNALKSNKITLTGNSYTENSFNEISLNASAQDMAKLLQGLTNKTNYQAKMWQTLHSLPEGVQKPGKNFDLSSDKFDSETEMLLLGRPAFLHPKSKKAYFHHYGNMCNVANTYLLYSPGDQIGMGIVHLTPNRYAEDGIRDQIRNKILEIFGPGI